MDLRKELHGVDEIIADVVDSRQAKLRPKFVDEDGQVEVCKHVFQQSCSTIAKHFESAGFTYLKSRQSCRKRIADFDFNIGFLTNSSNVAGAHVDLSVSATVSSPKLKKFRAKYPLLILRPFIAGGHLGRLQERPSKLSWELANPALRDEVVSDVIQAIETMALPYFAQFDELSTLIPRIVDDEIEAFETRDVIDFLMCFADWRSARLAAKNFYSRRPNFISQYKKHLAFCEKPETKQIYDHDHVGLATASYVYGFGDVMED